MNCGYLTEWAGGPSKTGLQVAVPQEHTRGGVGEPLRREPIETSGTAPRGGTPPPLENPSGESRLKLVLVYGQNSENELENPSGESRLKRVCHAGKISLVELENPSGESRLKLLEWRVPL